MASIKQTWTEESVSAMEMRAEREIHERQRDRALNGNYRKPKESLWAQGQSAAWERIMREPASVPFRLAELRVRQSQPFRFGDAKSALKAHLIRKQLRNKDSGEIATLEQYCRANGLHVPTPEEVEEQKIQDMLAAERSA